MNEKIVRRFENKRNNLYRGDDEISEKSENSNRNSNLDVELNVAFY